MSASHPRVLLFGKDARTDALAEACERSSRGPELHACGDIRNPGLAERCRIHRVRSLRDVDALVALARELRPDLALVGPEDPLDVGLVDALEAEGIACFGPRRAAARIETSKSWARELLTRHEIPGNPEHRVFTSTDGLRDYLSRIGPSVIKPDGLTGGKGVRVVGEHLAGEAEAFEYAAESVKRDGRVVVEERLEGEELSLQTITDGEAVVHCPLVQDHKRAFDGDVGPNTGGMGSYSCADHALPFLDPREVSAAQRINEAVIAALRSETGVPYRGVLYGGFMVTRAGLRVIEYNARFGDPEAMNVLPLLDADLVELCEAVTRGRLYDVDVRFRRRATVCKYLVPEGYPDAPVRGDRVEVDRPRLAELGARVYFAAVDAQDGGLVLTGSRAIAVVGVGADLAEAERVAEAATACVRGPLRHRRDIGTPDLLARRLRHVSALRG